MTSVIVSGVIAGFLYALLGAGLVVIYRQSRVLNFAHGAVGSVAAYIAYALIQAGAPYYAAAGGAVIAGVLLSALVERLVVRRLERTSDFTVGVATLGVALLIIGLVTLIWGTEPLPLAPPLSDHLSVSVLGVTVGATQLLAIGITSLVFFVLYAFVERTRFGLAMRAASEGPLTAGLVGVNVRRVQAISWALAGALASVAALLITPQYQLDPNFLTSFMITAFAGVVIGGLESIGGALVGGLVFGVATSLLSFYVSGQLTNTASLLAMLVALAFFPRGLFGRQLHRVPEAAIGRNASRGLSVRIRRPAGLSSVDHHIRAALVGSFVIVLVAVPVLVSSGYVYDLALVAATFPAVLGQNVIGGWGGQASIGQSGFMVVGGYLVALLGLHAHLPYLLMLVVAMIGSGVAGVVLAVVTARLSGIYLALVTLSFALALPELVSFSATGGADGLELPAPTIFGLRILDATDQYFMTLAIGLVAAAAVLIAARSAPGRSWRAVRDTEAGAASIGFSVPRVKVAVVAIGGSLAGLGGALTVTVVGYVSPDSFVVWTAIYLLAASVVGGASSVLGAVLGAAFITLIPIETASYPDIPQIVFGGAIVAAVLFAPRGLARLVRVQAPAQARAGADRPPPENTSDVIAEVADLAG